MTPYGNNFKILFRKFSPPHRLTLLCSNFVKYCRQETARYLPDGPKKKTKFWLPLKLSLLLGSRPKS